MARKKAAKKEPAKPATLDLKNLSTREGLVLYRALRTAPRNGLDDEVVEDLTERMIDLLGMREAVDAARAERAAEKAAKKKPAAKKRMKATKKSVTVKADGDLNPVEMVKSGALLE